MPNDQEKALVLWGNTTFGLLMYWWHSSKQQTGRGSIPKGPLGTLPVLDLSKLAPEALIEAGKVFDEFCARELRPLNEIDTDATRHELDDAFARRVLSLPPHMLAAGGPLDILRRKLASEPTVHGGKKRKAKANVSA